ncbi:endonuclease/exonuclease/phosphatase family protein [Streptomyces sp. MNP-20]|uniref:endonuclease/exonuclease/phosphatase family protein n=1 Tax=Streptomyces sp. MNP-20 TaxID=2721165 RepID=UPI001557430F|nr:endonuclease/exonuclease/phosphatase family protein [Streptomyces sp. MNP-20]
MTITVAQWNLEHDGGADGARWEQAHEILRAYQPDIVMRQEMTYSHQRGQQRLHATEHILGLRGFLAPPTPESPNSTALFVNPKLFQVDAVYPHHTLWWHPMSNVVAYFQDCPRPLSLGSFHLCSHDADTRLTEARRMTTLARPGMVSLIAGDCNSYPSNPEPGIPLPDWDTVTDRAHMVHRTYLSSTGERHSDIRPDIVLTDARFEDAARYAADHLGQPHALAPTAGQCKPHQGGPQRIDRAYACGGLAAALESVEIIDTKETREVGDHSLGIFRLNRGRLRRLLREAPPAA